jgi:dipeptidyl aminopeptidase/acylaminoacyl peptidase
MQNWKQYSRFSLAIKRFTCFLPLLGAILASSTALAQLPIEAFTSYPQFNNARLSPDGSHLALTSQQAAQDRIVILDTGTFTPVATFNSAEFTGIANFWWANDERIVFSTYRKFGWLDTPVLTGELYAFNTDDSRKFPIAGLATGDFAYYQVLNTLEDENDDILVLRKQPVDGGLVKARAEAVRLDIYERPRASGGRTARRTFRNTIESPQEYGDLLTDHTGAVRLAFSIDENGAVQAQVRDTDGNWAAVNNFSVPARESLLSDTGSIIGFNRNNDGLYYINTSPGGTAGLYLLDLASGTSTLLYAHEKYDIGASSMVWTSDEQEIIGVKFIGGLPEAHYFAEHPEVAMQQQLDAAFPEHLVRLFSFAADGSKALAVVSGDRLAQALFMLDRGTNQLRFISGTYPALPQEQMTRVDPIIITARDGVQLEGYVAVPGDSQEPLPMIVVPHGGPHGTRDSFLFNPELQMLTSRGYAVLQINFRGSGGYGRAFSELGVGAWGTGMVDDVIDATRWAIAENIALPDKVCIYGASYGGYSALMSVARYPDLFRCAVGYAGVYDLSIMNKGDVPFLPWGTTFIDTVLGTDPEVRAANSPVNLVAQIQAPLMIVHGGQDQRAPLEHAENLRKALDAAGKPYEWLVESQEGHGFANPDNRLKLYTQMLEFFARHLR